LGDDLTIPYNLDPSGDDVFSTLGGHLDVHLSSVTLVLGQHVAVSHVVSEVVDFGFVEVYHSSELVDVVVGFSKPLVSDCHASAYCGDEAVGDGAHGVIEVITVLHAEYGLS